jgi:hypothetical protein
MISRVSRMPRRANALRVALGLALLFALACAQLGRSRSERSQVAPLDPVSVRIGAIDQSAIDAIRRRAPSDVPERTEQIVDQFWQVGCLGENLNTTLATYRQSPDVACSLPGRTPTTILVAAHLDGKSGKNRAPEDWSGLALLPSLYRALRVEPREHSFLFVAFGDTDRKKGFHSMLARLDDAQREQVRAIVDLRDLSQPVLWSASEDFSLRLDLVAVTRALGRPPDSLRFFDPGPVRPPPLKKNFPKVHYSDEQKPDEPRRPLKVPGITIGGTAETRKLDQTTSHAASATNVKSSDSDYYATARVIAVFLGYLDETLRMRSAPPAEQAAGLPVAPETTAAPIAAPEP